MSDLLILLIIAAVAIFAAIETARARHHNPPKEPFKWPR